MKVFYRDFNCTDLKIYKCIHAYIGKCVWPRVLHNLDTAIHLRKRPKRLVDKYYKNFGFN